MDATNWIYLVGGAICLLIYLAGSSLLGKAMDLPDRDDRDLEPETWVE